VKELEEQMTQMGNILRLMETSEGKANERFEKDSEKLEELREQLQEEEDAVMELDEQVVLLITILAPSLTLLLIKIEDKNMRKERSF
jgi:uncharacterized membrane protein